MNISILMNCLGWCLCLFHCQQLRCRISRRHSPCLQRSNVQSTHQRNVYLKTEMPSHIFIFIVPLVQFASPPIAIKTQRSVGLDLQYNFSLSALQNRILPTKALKEKIDSADWPWAILGSTQNIKQRRWIARWTKKNCGGAFHFTSSKIYHC